MFPSTLFNAPKAQCIQNVSKNIRSILQCPSIQPGSLLILDIDDTIGRVSQAIGLDAWFRFRIAQHIAEGHSNSEALAKTIVIYNLAQLASPTMVPVDRDNPVAPLLTQLHNKGVKIIGLTARNNVLTDKTLSFLEDLGIAFSENIIKPSSFLLNDKPVIIKKGVIFANGNDKGLCIETIHQQNIFTTAIHAFNHISFVDDSQRNCQAVARSLKSLNIMNSTVWHYTYAEIHLEFDAAHQDRSKIQEEHLLEHNQLLDDQQSDNKLTGHTL